VAQVQAQRSANAYASFANAVSTQEYLRRAGW
jgi:hypothetical protein